MSAEGPGPVGPIDSDDRSLATEAPERTGRLYGATVGQRLAASITGASLRTTLLAVLSAVLIGSVILVLSSDEAPLAAVTGAYGALLAGSLGGAGAISETLVAATPLILTGLAVAIPLRAGLFNIGGESQVLAGGIAGGYVGFALTGLPLVVHLPLAIVAGLAGGTLIGWLPGFLKARTGAHEVISTIMLNNTMIAVTVWLLTTKAFQKPDRTDPISRDVLDSARLPRPSGSLRVDIGIVLALAVALLAYWFIERSTTGFELNAVGANPSAATAAGMDAARAIVVAMSTAGAFGGLAGAAVVLGVQGRISPGFSAGLGFDGITVALLGRGGIGGSIAAGLLLGAFKAGARAMQAETGTSLDLVVVIQSLIIVFIAAPGLVRAIYRVRAEGADGARISKGWGG
ncbi:MAG: hypothetical protein RLZZ272_341 [Actinomycetota bacterium]